MGLFQKWWHLEAYFKKQKETKANYLDKENFMDHMDFEPIVIREWGR